MPEMGTSGSMSGDGKRSGVLAAAALILDSTHERRDWVLAEEMPIDDSRLTIEKPEWVASSLSIVNLQLQSSMSARRKSWGSRFCLISCLLPCVVGTPNPVTAAVPRSGIP
jgi:hypothetical protein